MKSHRDGDSQVADDLVRLNSFSEAGNFTPIGLDNSLLNRDLEGNSDYFPPAPQTLDHRSAGQYERENVVAPSTGQFQFHSSINTPTSFRPQHLRRFSHLRNEYLPSTEPETSMAGPHSQQVFTSSPSRYTLRPQPGSQLGPSPSQILQPFEESNVRSSPQHLPSYNSVNQLAQHQQLTYPDPQQYSQHPFNFPSYAGLPYLPISQHTSATPRYVIGTVI